MITVCKIEHAYIYTSARKINDFIAIGIISKGTEVITYAPADILVIILSLIHPNVTEFIGIKCPLEYLQVHR